MNKYRVQITIKGAIFRPYYDGYIDVWVEDNHPTGNMDMQRPTFLALRKSGIWDDISEQDVQVKSCERVS